MPAKYKVYVDWNADGDFSDAGEDVTGRVLDGRSQVTMRYGRDQTRNLSPTSPGEAHWTLNNQSRDYSPENASSPLTGLIEPGRQVYVKAVLGGVDYPMLIAFLDDFTVLPAREERSVSFDSLDALGRLRGAKVSTEMYRGIRTGDAIGVLLDAAGWPTALRDLDAGATVMPWWWVDDADAFDALMDLTASEGPTAIITVDTVGRIVFRDRHHRLLRAASQTVQSTWRASGKVEPLVSAPVDYNHGAKEIINALAFPVTIRARDVTYSTVWTTQDRIVIAAGDTVVVTAKPGGGFFDAQVPVEGTDYTLAQGGAFVALSRTSGGSTDITLTAAAGQTIIDSLSLRAVAVVETGTTIVKIEDSTSITKYGTRSGTDVRDPIWANVYDARAIGELIIGRRAQRVPTIAVTMVGANNTRLTQMLTRNLGDRVHLVEPHTGLDADCTIEQISHTIGQGGLEHRTTFGLEKTPSTVSPVLRFDTAGAGFDQGRFPGTGYDDPATMFRFDVSGQGFDQGVFAN